jgi:hypothetical protein
MPSSQVESLLNSVFGNWKRPLVSPTSFQASLQFVPSEDRSGKDFQYPILTAISQGVTTDNTGGVVTLRKARPGKNNRATLDGVNVYIRESLSYSDLMKMANGASASGDKQAYSTGPAWTMFSMKEGLKHASEIMAMYGAGTNATIGDDIGVVFGAAVSGGPNWDASPVVQLTRGSWARRLWLNSGSGGDVNSGMLVDIYNSAGTTLLVNNVRCVGVRDAGQCRVEFDTTTETTIGGSGVAVAAGQRIVRAGWAASSALGVYGILNNNGSFAGIDNTTIPQWKPEVLDLNNSALTFSVLQKFVGRLGGNGAKGPWTAWCSNSVMSTLISTLDPNLRWNDGAGKDGRSVGTGALTVDTPHGPLKLREYGYCKQGQVAVVNEPEAVRIGAAEERDTGIEGTGLALELPDQAGSEMRAMAQFAPLLTTPFYSGLIKNVKSADDDFGALDT